MYCVEFGVQGFGGGAGFQVWGFRAWVWGHVRGLGP